MMHRYLPETPGVYVMKDAAGRVLYVGKAGNVKRRVASYFTKARDSRLERLVRDVRKIDVKKTDTVIEALILEAELIKKLSPPFNIREKDDKSFLFVEITREKFPRAVLVRGKDPVRGKRFGPFTSAGGIREALRILRRIFPWSENGGHQASGIKRQVSRLDDVEAGAKGRGCLDYQIGLCPGTCCGAVTAKEYRKNIENLAHFLRGEKKKIIRSLTEEMRAASKRLHFERAEKLRRKLFSLQHIHDVALIGESRLQAVGEREAKRIEGYDISNISGDAAVGSMVVFEDEKAAPSLYRKFKIKTVRGPDDAAMLREVVARRLRHREWPLPNLVLVDGGVPQVNAVRRVLRAQGAEIPVVGLAKGPERKRNDVFGVIPSWASRRTLIRVRDEAHRFAVAYHKKVRGKKFLDRFPK